MVRNTAYGVVTAVTAAAWLAAGCGPREAARAPAPRPPADVREALELAAGDDPAAARDALAEAAERYPSNATVRAALGLIHRRAGRDDLALASFEQAAALAPDDPRPLEYAARVQVDAANWDAARVLLDRANRRLSYSPRILTAMGVVEARAGDAAMAKAFFDQALAADAQYAPALYNLGVLYRDTLRDPARADATLRRYLEVADDPARIAAVHARLAPAPTPPSGRQDPEPPVRAPTPSPAPAPQPVPQPAPDPVAPQLAEARQALRTGATDTALVMLKQLVSQHPDHPDVLWELARVYDRELGIEARARTYYERFRDAAPGDPRVASIPAPKPTPRPAPKPDPQAARNAGDLWREALAAQKQGRADRAITLYREALTIDDTLFVAWYNVGLLYKDKGRLDEAATAFDHAVALRSDHADAAYMRAVVDYARGRYEETLQRLDAMLAARPDHVRGQYLAGLARSRLGHRGTARAHFQQVAALDRDGRYGASATEWLDANTRPAPPAPRP